MRRKRFNQLVKQVCGFALSAIIVFESVQVVHAEPEEDYAWNEEESEDGPQVYFGYWDQVNDYETTGTITVADVDGYTFANANVYAEYGPYTQDDLVAEEGQAMIMVYIGGEYTGDDENIEEEDFQVEAEVSIDIGDETYNATVTCTGTKSGQGYNANGNVVIDLASDDEQENSSEETTEEGIEEETEEGTEEGIEEETEEGIEEESEGEVEEGTEEGIEEESEGEAEEGTEEEAEEGIYETTDTPSENVDEQEAADEQETDGSQTDDVAEEQDDAQEELQEEDEIIDDTADEKNVEMVREAVQNSEMIEKSDFEEGEGFVTVTDVAPVSGSVKARFVTAVSDLLNDGGSVERIDKILMANVTVSGNSGGLLRAYLGRQYAGRTAYSFHFGNDIWERKHRIKISDDGFVDAGFDSFSPIAFVVVSEKSNSDSDGGSSNDEKPPHVHKFEWVITDQPTLKRLGEKAYRCEECGKVLETLTIDYMAYLFNDIKKTLDSAPLEGSVRIETGGYYSLNKSVVEALEKRSDVTVTFVFEFEDKKYEMVVPEGFDWNSTLNDDGWTGFMYIGSFADVTLTPVEGVGDLLN